MKIQELSFIKMFYHLQFVLKHQIKHTDSIEFSSK